MIMFFSIVLLVGTMVFIRNQNIFLTAFATITTYIFMLYMGLFDIGEAGSNLRIISQRLQYLLWLIIVVGLAIGWAYSWYKKD